MPHRHNRPLELATAAVGPVAAAETINQLRRLVPLVRRVAGVVSDNRDFFTTSAMAKSGRKPGPNRKVKAGNGRRAGAPAKRKQGNLTGAPQKSIMTTGAPGLSLSRSGTGSTLKYDYSLLVAVTNTGVGTANATVRMSLDELAGITSLASWSTRLTTYRGLYRQWHLKSMKTQFVPALSDNAEGIIGITVDADTRFGNMTAPGDVLTNGGYILTNVRMPGTFLWRPSGRRDLEEKFTTRSTGGGSTRENDELGYGSLTWFSTNSSANGITIGHLMLSGTIVFEAQC